MPRYFFNLFNDLNVADDEGIDLPDVAAAMEHAAENARELAAESVREGHLVLGHRIEITDDSGAVVGVVHFRDVVKVTDQPA